MERCAGGLGGMVRVMAGLRWHLLRMAGNDRMEICKLCIVGAFLGDYTEFCI